MKLSHSCYQYHLWTWVSLLCQFLCNCYDLWRFHSSAEKIKGYLRLQWWANKLLRDHNPAQSWGSFRVISSSTVWWGFLSPKRWIENHNVNVVICVYVHILCWRVIPEHQELYMQLTQSLLWLTNTSPLCSEQSLPMCKTAMGGRGWRG